MIIEGDFDVEEVEVDVKEQKKSVSFQESESKEASSPKLESPKRLRRRSEPHLSTPVSHKRTLSGDAIKKLSFSLAAPEPVHHTPWFSPRSMHQGKEPVKKEILRAKDAPVVRALWSIEEKKQSEILNRLIEGDVLTKISRTNCSLLKRWFSLSKDGSQLLWEKPWEARCRKNKAGALLTKEPRSRDLASVVRVTYGTLPQRVVAKNPALTDCVPWLCFTLELALTTKDLSQPEIIGIICADEQQLNLWLQGISQHCPATRKNQYSLGKILWQRMKLKLRSGPSKKKGLMYYLFRIYLLFFLFFF